MKNIINHILLLLKMEAVEKMVSTLAANIFHQLRNNLLHLVQQLLANIRQFVVRNNYMKTAFLLHSNATWGHIRKA